MAGARSRTQLLDAAAALLVSDGWALVTGAIPAARVCQQAGLTRRTYYDNFPTTEDFATALREHVSSGSSGMVVPGIGDALARGDLRGAVASLVAEQGRAMANQPAGAISYGVAMLAGERRADVWLDAWRMLTSWLEHLGFSARPPLSAETVALSVYDMTASAWALGGGQHDDSEIVEAALALLASAFVPAQLRDEPSPVDALVQHAGVATRERGSALAVVHVRRLVLDTASSLLRERGLLGLSLTNLARQTGLSASLIGKHVGAVADILREISDEPAAGLDVALQADRSSKRSADECHDRHLERFAQYCSERPEVAHALVAVALARQDGSPLPGKLGASVGEWAQALRVQEDPLWAEHVRLAVDAVLLRAR